jgi:hypothetical protein
MGRFLRVYGTCFLFIFSTKILAQDEFEKVQVLESPRYSLLDRFVVDGDFSYLPLDAYFKPLLLEASVTYQPMDLFSWEIGRFGYSVLNYDTALRDNINAQLATVSQVVDPDDLHLERLRFRASSTAFLNLFYSKSNLLNRSVAYHQWAIGVGPSYYDMRSKSQMGVDLVMKVRFFIDDHFSVNIRGGHTIGFKDKVPKNITFLTLGAGFAF